MSFKDIKDRLVKADEQALSDFNASLGWGARAGIEDQLSFIEYRRSMLAGAIGLILDELIAMEEKP